MQPSDSSTTHATFRALLAEPLSSCRARNANTSRTVRRRFLEKEAPKTSLEGLLVSQGAKRASRGGWVPRASKRPGHCPDIGTELLGASSSSLVLANRASRFISAPLSSLMFTVSHYHNICSYVPHHPDITVSTVSTASTHFQRRATSEKVLLPGERRMLRLSVSESVCVCV